jgi:hypothetical protein
VTKIRCAGGHEHEYPELAEFCNIVVAEHQKVLAAVDNVRRAMDRVREAGDRLFGVSSPTPAARAETGRSCERCSCPLMRSHKGKLCDSCSLQVEPRRRGPGPSNRDADAGDGDDPAYGLAVRRSEERP